MADVFMSYAREDRTRASALAHALEGQGWSVWWDRHIVPGQAFDRAIEGELMRAGSVVVLWSAHSVDSEWVRNEAAAAAERGVLVPALLDAVHLPLEFRRRQTADLAGWHGDPAHPGFQSLCAGIAAALGAAPPPAPAKAERRRRPWVAVALTALSAVLAVGIYAIASRRASAPVPAPGAAPGHPAPVATTPAPSPISPAPTTELADLVAGRYFGAVIADSQGPSRSDISVTIAKLDPRTVRVSSNYARLGSTDVTLTRTGNTILSAGGDTPFIVDLDKRPPTLVFDPHSAIAYRGTKQD